MGAAAAARRAAKVWARSLTALGDEVVDVDAFGEAAAAVLADAKEEVAGFVAVVVVVLRVMGRLVYSSLLFAGTDSTVEEARRSFRSAGFGLTGGGALGRASAVTEMVLERAGEARIMGAEVGAGWPPCLRLRRSIRR